MPKIIVTPDRKLGISGRVLRTDAGGGECCCGGGTGPCTFPGDGCCFTRQSGCTQNAGEILRNCRCGKRFQVDLVGHMEYRSCEFSAGTNKCDKKTVIQDHIISGVVPPDSNCHPYETCCITRRVDASATIDDPLPPGNPFCNSFSDTFTYCAPGDSGVGLSPSGNDWCGLTMREVWELILTKPAITLGHFPWSYFGGLPPPPFSTGQFSGCSGDTGFFFPGAPANYSHRFVWACSWECTGGTLHYEYYRQGNGIDPPHCAVLTPYTERIVSDASWSITPLADCDSTPLAPSDRTLSTGALL